MKQIEDKHSLDELLDLVNDDDELIGTMPRSEVYAKHISNFRVINVFLMNSEGKILVPRRSASKSVYPSCLDTSVGGHVDNGETYEEAFKRELWEELLIDADKTPFELIAHLTPKNDGVWCFMNVYLIRTDKEPEFNKEEVAELYWLTPKELIERIEKGDGAKSDLPIIVKKVFPDSFV